MNQKTNTDKILNTFEGSHAVLDFLNPDNAPYTPLVEIPDHLNPYRKDGVRIFAKLMNMLPLANVKSLPAYNMLLDKKEKGQLDGVDTVIENSSGNTVFSLAVISRLMGISHTKAIVSHEVSRGKLNLLRFLGTEIIVNEEPICPDPSDKTSGIYKAKKWAKENNWFNPGQYDNEANPEAHYKWTGPQIWEQTKEKVSLLSVGLGTTGSVTGTGRYLKEKNPTIKILGVSRIINNPVPGVRTNNLLKEIAFNWKSILDYQEEVGTIESYEMSLKLCRAGLFVGPSSGFAFVGLLNHLSKQNLSGEEKIAVFMCPDSPLPYIEEYFKYLNPHNFPVIENESLLKEQQVEMVQKESLIKESSPHEIFNLVFLETVKELWDTIKNKKEISLNKKIKIVDLRTESEFEDHNIPTSIHIPYHDIDDFLKKNKRKLKKYEAVVFVCRHGAMSRLATFKAQEMGIKSINLKGGDAEWSRLNLPRIRSENCIKCFDL